VTEPNQNNSVNLSPSGALLLFIFGFRMSQAVYVAANPWL
jgi:hypothetical protein